jgi:hypothetical protein
MDEEETKNGAGEQPAATEEGANRPLEAEVEEGEGKNDAQPNQEESTPTPAPTAESV